LLKGIDNSLDVATLINLCSNYEFNYGCIYDSKGYRERRNKVIRTTIYLYRIGERLYGKSCDTIVEFDIIEKPEDDYIGKIIEQKLGFKMMKGESNSFVTEDGRIEIRYHHWEYSK